MASKWLPIESAPKDGTLILILEGSGRVQLAKWCCPCNMYDWYVQLTHYVTDSYPTNNVVAWAPLPEGEGFSEGDVNTERKTF
jgi:hypothetical protein